MAASKLAAYDIGYDDQRFEHVVSQTLHCIICTNVIKDPVTCRYNEHVFCRGCITRHLMNSRTCPTCIQPLTVETLKVPRTIANLLSELKIRCEFFHRGCKGFIALRDLEKHVADCGFAPALCTNRGCKFEANKQDLEHHETSVCERRRVKCHRCDNTRQEMVTLKRIISSMKERMKKNEVITITVEENHVSEVERIFQGRLNKQEESNRKLEAEIVEMKTFLNEITKQLKIKNDKVDSMDREPKVVVAGGDMSTSKSVEMFSQARGAWTRLQPMRERRGGGSLFVHNDNLFIMGGLHNKSIERLQLNDHDAVQSTTNWEIVPVDLPGPLYGHGSVVYHGRLIVIGGYDGNERASSQSIYVISFNPPYTSSKLLFTMPQRRCLHGVAIFDDKILIVGGRETLSINTCLKSVILHDITQNECQELAPLPYPVSDMATVKWGEENAIIIGGADGNGSALSTVLIYNITTQESYFLPDMKYKRQGCTAVVVRDTVIVMGGVNGRGCVEGFRFDRYSWQELPEMHEARLRPTAAVC